jgi:hypothetical protein
MTAGPFPAATPPTPAQQAWLTSHKDYVRTSHLLHAKTMRRGTLWPDGTFVPEAPGRPVMDGNGAFGVGVLTRSTRR